MADGEQSPIALAATPWAERGSPKLTREHQEYLSKRVARGYWKQAGFRSDSDGIIIPYYGPDGLGLDGFARKRLVPPVKDADGKEQKFSQPPGTKNRLYFAPGIDWRKRPKHVYLGEGELRAAAFAAHGVPALAIGGVWNFLTRDDENDGTSKLIPDFGLMDFKDLEVTLVYDTDVTKKYKLQRALLRQAAILEGKGAKVDVLIVPDLGDGKTGIDDYIQARGIKAALALPRRKLTDEFFLFWGAPTDPNPTDVGNAERFSDMHATQVRFVPQWRSWVVWKGHRWARDSVNEVGHRAIITARRIYREASSITDSLRRETLGKWAMASESAGRLKAMVEVASTLPEFATSAQEFDARPMLFCAGNGVVDLTSGELEPGRPEWLLTRGSPVEFDPKAACPRWEAFLEETFSGDADMIAYLRRCFGYFLTGSTAEQCFFIFYGIGQNGKTTVIEVLQGLLGEYVVKSRMETWVQQARVAAGQSEDIARLAGARLVFAEEGEEEQRLAVSLIKEATGGDKLTARNMYEKSFEFAPQFKLVIVSNHKPVVPGDDFALWRRIRLVPFSRTVPDAKKVKDYAKKRLLPELPGIFNWALRGLKEYRELGDLGMPQAVRDATASYKSDSDLLGQFLEEECAVEPQEDGRPLRTAVDTTELYKKYQAWMDERGYRAARTMTWFSRRMQDRGFRKQEGSRRSRLVGLTLRDAAVGNFTEGRPSGKVQDIKSARGKKKEKF